MSKKNHGLGFARIAKLVTSKNQNNLRKEEAQVGEKERGEERITNLKQIGEKRE